MSNTAYWNSKSLFQFNGFMPVQKMIFKCLQFVIINFDDFDITKMYFYIATQSSTN